MSAMEPLNPRKTSLPIGERHVEREWDDDDPTAPEVPTDIAADPAMRTLLRARAGLPLPGEVDLCQWVVMNLPGVGDFSWEGWINDARRRVRVLHAVGVGFGHVSPDPFDEFAVLPLASSDRMVLDRAIDWLHTELLAEPR